MNKQSSLSVQAKLALSFASIILLTIFVVIMSIKTITNAQKVAVERLDELAARYNRTKYAIDAATAFHDFTTDLVDKVKSNPMGVYNYSATSVFESDLKKYTDALQMSRFPKEMGETKECAKDYIQTYNELLVPALKEAASTGEFFEVNRIMTEKLDRDYSVIAKHITFVNGYKLKAASEAMEGIASARTIYTIIACALVEVLVALGFYLYLPKSISTEIKTIVKSAKLLASGDLSCEIHTKRNDEFKPLATCLEEMRTSWQKNIASVVDVS
ncbi:MAG: hypothetical protein ACI4NE_02835, partial [Succinivibrio sp.]